MKTIDFSETIAACGLKVGRCRHLIEQMKVFKYSGSNSFLGITWLFVTRFVYAFFSRPRSGEGLQDQSLVFV